ncbi:uncharacterized protein BJ171DRAFT_631816 [Polychytrium aggregatum]|uniref:uncharacterized protein n=1 Tax=Polychytrium aggregatum TaxID=110093 RepID=UPI0022FE45DC|nr:uncharacterized protein BJ171DRAFT_631816 [Polychytrium aggregatum]KAI9199340.1 hypothetical protein BJ171DRAFT_631816 [Polychytrium aggregatum]
MSEIHVADLADLAKGAMKEVSTPVGKVLLSRIEDRVYATAALCPHAKASLVKGTLSSDGRLMCPWHGACFHVASGDIEDGPAIDHLRSYKVSVRDDKVMLVLEGNVSLIHATGWLDVGTGFQLGFLGRILMITSESYLPVERPKIGKSLKIDAAKIALRDAAYFTERDILVRLNTEAVSVDTGAKTVVVHNITSDQRECISYNRLPRVPQIPGHELRNVFTIRRVEDANALDAALAAVSQGQAALPRIVIIGSGFIGLEAAAVLAKKAKVEIVGRERIPLQKILGPRIGQAIQKLHEQNGVVFHNDGQVAEIRPSGKFVLLLVAAGNSNPEVAGSVVLADGRVLEAAIVIFGVGVVLSTQFLEGSAIQVDADGGIAVDKYLGVKGQEYVYAAGDIARYPYHLEGAAVRIEHWNVAMDQGRTVARNIYARMTGKSELQGFQSVPYFWSTQYGKSLRYSGHCREGFDEVIIQGSTDLNPDGSGLGFCAFYVKNSQVVAASSIARDPVVSHFSELLRLGKAPTPEQLRNGLEITTVSI